MESLVNTTVTLMVSDLDRSVRFYTKTLGLKLKQRYGDHYAEIEGPGLLLGLHPSEEQILAGDLISIGFGVSGFDKEVASLQAQGLSLHVNLDGWIRLAHFKDPDGHALYLADIK